MIRKTKPGQGLLSLLIAFGAIGLALPMRSSCQPWTAPLMIAYSGDGAQFDAPVLFQDSSGVPSAVRWKGDTMICVFQWARLPMGSPTWDRVAVKFSFDNGIGWTSPQPVEFHDLPPGYQRPFDPTLAVVPGDSLRLYFSSSDGIPPPGADSLINTYSAVSADGVNYFFEPNPRVDHPTNRVIDPAVIRFNGLWHYLSPIGSPQSGAYHYLSPDGIHFTMAPNIGSDPQHNWTGNFVVNAGDELRFYGSGMPFVWYNSSPNGGDWTGYRNTSVRGGDPTVVRRADGTYFMITVGARYLAVGEPPFGTLSFRLHPNYPNPFNESTVFRCEMVTTAVLSLQIFDVAGRWVDTLFQGMLDPGSHSLVWHAGNLPSGIYFGRAEVQGIVQIRKLALLK